MPEERDLCEWGGCVDPAEWRVLARTQKQRTWLEDKIRCCTKHADLLSAQSEFGPRARIVVTREPLPPTVTAPDAAL